MINFTNTGFVNFKKEYNKVLKNGAITASMTMSEKDKDGEYLTKYVNVLVSQKAVDKNLINKELVDVEGFITQTNHNGEKYNNFIITKMTKHFKNESENEDDGLPF